MSHLHTLSDRFFGGFKGIPSWRRIGREAEHPVVYGDGRHCELSELWPILLKALPQAERVYEGTLLVGLNTADFSLYSEVGKGTIEVIVGPVDGLHALKSLYEAGMRHVLGAAKQVGAHVLGAGIQPLTPGTRALMTEKARYGVLLERIGDPWLSFTLTASDQIHVDIGRTEALPAVNLCNALSAVVLALCANSTIYGGVMGPFLSGREGMMGEIDAAHGRHGMPQTPFHDEPSFIQYLVGLDFLMFKKDGIYQAYKQTFADWLDGAPGSAEERWNDFLLHEHYVWHSARLRNHHSTLELRAACQQPQADTMVVAALSLGLVSAHEAILSYVQSIWGEMWWATLSDYRRRALVEGLSDRTLPSPFLSDILDLCAEALEARGLGEAAYLSPLYERLAAGENPAQRARSIFKSDGMDGFLKAFAFK